MTEIKPWMKIETKLWCKHAFSFYPKCDFGQISVFCNGIRRHGLKPTNFVYSNAYLQQKNIHGLKPKN
jgi:hypothetical protein